MLQNTNNMGNKPHHSGHYGGGVDLSKGKTPHDSLMKYMPVDDKGSSILKVGKPYEMGMSMRGPLDKQGLISMDKNAAIKAATKKAMAKAGSEVAAETATQLATNKLESSHSKKSSFKEQVGKAARAIESKAPGVFQSYFDAARK